MSWYFVSAGAQAGPVSDIQLDEYILAGKVLPDTLVWREGMENWLPCREAKPTAPFKFFSSASKASPVPASPISSVGEIVCAECGALQPKDNAIKYGEDWICAGCKPLRIQKLKEGVLPKTGATAMDYAGVGGRFLAKFLDMLIIGGIGGLIMGVVTAILVPMIRTQGRNAAGGIVLAWLGILTIVVVGMIFYQIWCLPKYGATPGKRILGLRVVTADGARSLSAGRLDASLVNG